MNTNKPLPDLYTVNEAASVCRVKPATIRRWIAAGRLPARRLGPHSTRVTRRDLERLINQKEH